MSRSFVSFVTAEEDPQILHLIEVDAVIEAHQLTLSHHNINTYSHVYSSVRTRYIVIFLEQYSKCALVKDIFICTTQLETAAGRMILPLVW